MAATGSPTTTFQGTIAARFIPTYWDSVLGENLYPNLYLYQFGTKRRLPRNFGSTIKIPRLRKQNIVAAINSASEGVAIGTCPISADYISGTLTQFAGAYKHSDILIFTSLSDVIELSLRDIARDVAKKMDAHVRNQISGKGLFIGGSGRATSAAMSNIDYLTPSDIVRAVIRLDALDNPRPPDNHYPTIIHPLTLYNLFTKISGNAWVDVNKYTDSNVNKLFIGEMGRMFGARFVTSTNMRRWTTASLSTISGVKEFMFAPDAYYVTEISDLTARTYIKQLGSAGAADPVNQFATVGAKVYFGVVVASEGWTSTEYRMARLMHVNSIAGGATT